MVQCLHVPRLPPHLRENLYQLGESSLWVTKEQYPKAKKDINSVIVPIRQSLCVLCKHNLDRTGKRERFQNQEIGFLKCYLLKLWTSEHDFQVEPSLFVPFSPVY